MPTTNDRGLPLYSSSETMPGWAIGYNAQSNALSTALDASEQASKDDDAVETIADLPVTGNWAGRVIMVEENDMLYVHDGTGWYIYGGKLPFFFGSRTYSALSAGSLRQDFITTEDSSRGISFADGEITFETIGIYRVDLSVVWEANVFGQRNLGVDGTDFTALGPSVTYMFPDSLIQVTQQFSTYIAVTSPGAVVRPYVDQNSLSALNLEGSACVMWVSA